MINEKMLFKMHELCEILTQDGKVVDDSYQFSFDFIKKDNNLHFSSITLVRREHSVYMEPDRQ